MEKTSYKEYLNKRKSILQKINDQKYSTMQISEDELAANEIFKKIVAETNNLLPIDFHLNAGKYLKETRGSRLYKLLKRMPKASLHHLHFDAYPLADFYISILRNNAEEFYINFETQRIHYGTQPEPKDKWQSVKDIGKERDEEIYHMLTLHDYNPENPWVKFNLAYENRQIVTAVPKFAEEVLEKCCQLAIEEGFTNLQVKQLFPFFNPDLNLEVDYEIKILKKLQEKMRKIEPIFTIGLVFLGLRFFDENRLRKTIEGAYASKIRNPDIVLAFDYVQEETTRETKEFANVFIDIIDKQKEDGVSFPFVLHAGECITGKNTNIIESLAFGNCARIGHGINLVKYPQLYSTIKDMGSCIELNPISNHVLKYVNDLRMHPGVSFLNYGIKVSISSDDPGLFDTDTVIDFFACAFSMEFDLLDFKRCILNSIECSLMGDDVNKTMKEDFETKWESFIKLVLSNEI